MTPKQLARHIRRLSPGGTFSDHLGEAISLRGPSKKVWYSTQKEHWLGWLNEYDGPGAYGRVDSDRNAEFVYNHIMCPPMLLWLGEAAGVATTKVRNAYQAALGAGPRFAAMCAAIRREIPWAEVEALLSGPRHALVNADSFPIYKQLASDNSCGPRCILMVADYFAKERGRKLYAHEWSDVLEITMENDLAWAGGTRWEDMPYALSAIGLGHRRIQGGSPETGRKALRNALDRNHPVIVSCLIPYRGKPVRHYAVLVAMDDNTLFFADPFPHKDSPPSALRVIPWSKFQANHWSKKATVWGQERWALEVFFRGHTKQSDSRWRGLDRQEVRCTRSRSIGKVL